MSMIVSDSGGSFTPCPAGSHIAICIGYVDLGTQNETFEGKQKTQRKLRIMWELCEERTADGKLFTTGKTYTNNLGDKASLRKHLESWRSRPFTPDELKGFNLDNIVGKPCLLTIVHKPKQDGGISDSIGGISPLHRSMPVPKQVNPTTIFVIDQFDHAKFDKLPVWLQAKILLSPEGTSKRAGFPVPGAAPTSANRHPNAAPPAGGYAAQSQYGPGSHEPTDGGEIPF